MTPEPFTPIASMKLTSLVKGRIERPLRAVIYGPEGCGKSTFGANAPAPIFIAAEDGTDQLDVQRFPKPTEWGDVLAALRTLLTETHPFKTVVVDTLDAIEPLIWRAIVARANKAEIKSIEDFGYGKGYAAALDEWRIMLALLDALRNKGMNVLLLAHSWIKTFKSPEAGIDDFDRYELKLNAKAAGLIKEWSDAVLFATYETLTREKDGKVKGVSTGARLMFTNRTAAYDAKNRHSLPERLPLAWSDLDKAIRAGAVSPDKMNDEIAGLIARVPEKVKKEATAALARAGGSHDKLALLRDWLAGQVN